MNIYQPFLAVISAGGVAMCSILPVILLIHITVQFFCDILFGAD